MLKSSKGPVMLHHLLHAILSCIACVVQISLDTKDVFIEITATDLTKAQIVLNTVCTMFCQYCSTPFEVEPVEVIDSFGDKKCEALLLLPCCVPAAHAQHCPNLHFAADTFLRHATLHGLF